MPCGVRQCNPIWSVCCQQKLVAPSNAPIAQCRFLVSPVPWKTALGKPSLGGFVVIGSALRPTGQVVHGLHKVQSVLSRLLAMISTSILLTSSLSFVSTTTSAQNME
jgi:hypothetical protein